jgi:hypothetical protein
MATTLKVREWRHATFGLEIPSTEALATLQCPFFIETQTKDSIPSEYTINIGHFVGGQEILGTGLKAPWTSYYTKLQNGTPIAVANYTGVWFKTKPQEKKTVAVRVVRSESGVQHLPYKGINMATLTSSGEPTPTEVRKAASRASSVVRSEPERDAPMPEQSSTARGHPFALFENQPSEQERPRGGPLQGIPPEKFDGERNDTEDFLMRFKHHMALNRDSAIAVDPIKKAMYFLSFMKGSKTRGWLRIQSSWLEELEEDPSILPIMKNAWQVVEHNFRQAFVDYSVKEKVQDALHKLEMKEGNIDQYITDFQLLALNANVDVDEPTVLQLFYNSLPNGLARQCILQEHPHDFTSWANAAQRQQRNWFLIQTLEKKGGKKQNQQRNKPQNPQQWGWNNRNKGGQNTPARPKAPPFNPDAMEVDTI